MLASNTAMVNLQSQNGLITNGPRSFAHPTSKISPTATISGARFGQSIEASRDIDTIAEDVIVLDDTVTLVDADRNSLRLLVETAASCSVTLCGTANAQRIASMTLRELDQDAVFIRPGALWS